MSPSDGNVDFHRPGMNMPLKEPKWIQGDDCMPYQFPTRMLWLWMRLAGGIQEAMKLTLLLQPLVLRLPRNAGHVNFKGGVKRRLSGWWFQIFYFFTLTWGDNSI